MSLLSYTFHEGSATDAFEPADFNQAVERFNPDAEIAFTIGERVLDLEPQRDLYGLRHDLLQLLEKLAFHQDGNRLYQKEAGIEIPPNGTLHTLVLSDFYHHIPILFLAVSDDRLSVQTRTLIGSEVVTTPDDVLVPDTMPLRQVIAEGIGFLREYYKRLAQAMPAVLTMDEYRSALERLKVIDETLAKEV